MIDTMQKIRNLASDECSCYSPILNGIKHYCDQEKDKDYTCKLFKGERCAYFEKFVLPLNPQLQELYKSELKAKTDGYKITEENKKDILQNQSPIIGEIKVECARCGEPFVTTDLKGKYCRLCKKIIQREKRYAKV